MCSALLEVRAFTGSDICLLRKGKSCPDDIVQKPA